jgi:CDP-diacylglycerol---glycerol-3-phosphate 3-phosphatidyltransferase
MIVIPTLLSLLRILLAPLFVFLFWQGGIALWLSIVVFSIAAITDMCDGYLARKYGVTSTLGAFLDPIADKILIGSAFVCLVLKGVMAGWMAVLIMSRDVLITCLRMLAIRRGIVLPTSYLAKGKTVVQFIAIYLAFLYVLVGNGNVFISGGNSLFLIVKLAMYLVVGLTIYTGVDYVYTYWKAQKR